MIQLTAEQCQAMYTAAFERTHEFASALYFPQFAMVLAIHAIVTAIVFIAFYAKYLQNTPKEQKKNYWWGLTLLVTFHAILALIFFL